MRYWDTLSDTQRNKLRNFQLAREDEWKERAVLKYRESILKANEAPPCLDNFIDETAASFATALQHYIESTENKGRFPDWVVQVMTIGYDAIAYTFVKTVLDVSIHSLLLGNDTKTFDNNEFNLPRAQKLARDFTSAVVDLKRWFAAKDAEPEFFKYQTRFFKAWNPKRRRAFTKKVDAWKKPTQKMQDSFGNVMVRLGEMCGLITTINVRVATSGNNYKTVLHVGMSEDMLNFLRQRVDEYLHTIAPSKLPMLCRPVDWTEDSYGGFMDFTMRGKRRMSRMSTDGDGDRLEDTNLLGDLQLAALNTLQHNEWKINATVFDTMVELWQRGEAFGSAPSSESSEIEDMGPRPDKGEDPEAYAKWMDARAKAWGSWYQNENARIQHALRVREGGKLKPFTFWHAYFCDFRGRAYSDSYLIHPQGGDLDKALLKAAAPREVTSSGIYWIKVNLANLFGVDKVSFDDRVQFVDDNVDKWRRIAADPIGTRAEWEDDASKKNATFQRLAAIADLIMALDQGLTEVPVQLDGSCNGIQHWAALTRDDNIGPRVNLTPGDKPQDVYQLVADKCADICMSIDDDHGWNNRFIAHYSQETGEFKIPRKVPKRSVMCDPYGISNHSVTKYVINEGHMNWLDDPKDVRNAGTAMGKLIVSAKAEAMEHCNHGKEYVKLLCGWVAGETGKPLTWITPSGFTAVNMYSASEQRKSRDRIWAKDFTFAREYALSFGNFTPEYDDKAAISAMPPNYVHSLDAAHMFLVLFTLTNMGVEFYSMIHDSFGVLAPDVPMLRDVIKDTFYEIHKEDQLAKLRDHAEAIVGKRLPEDHPARKHECRGQLDIADVLRSDYIFG